MNSPPVLCGLVEKELLSFQNTCISGFDFMCSGKITVLSLLVHTKQGVSSCVLERHQFFLY
jgi:hypothetical protein